MKHKRPDVVAREAQHKEKTYKISFGDGLFLWVSPKNKYWRGRYWINGKEKSLSLGHYPAVSVTAARDGWAAAKLEVKQGLDPSLERKIAMVESIASVGSLFEDITNDYMDYRKQDLTAATLKRNWSVLNLHVLPIFGDIPAERISTPMVVNVARSVATEIGGETAHRVLVLVDQIFRHARHSGVVGEHNPGAAAKGALRPHKKQHYPAILDENRLGQFLVATRHWSAGVSVKTIIRIAPHLAQRGVDLRHMTWDSLDLDSSEPTWTYIVRKSGERHVVPLSDFVAKQLRAHQVFLGGNEICFPGVASMSKPVSAGAVNVAFKRMGFDGEITLHSMRAIFRTLGEERVGISPYVLERVLAHHVASRDSLRGAYARGSLIDARREAMQRWSDYLQDLENQAVVRLKEAA